MLITHYKSEPRADTFESQRNPIVYTEIRVSVLLWIHINSLSAQLRTLNLKHMGLSLFT